MNHRRFLRLSLISLASASVAVGQAATGAAKSSSSPVPGSAHSQAAAPAAPESAAKSAPAESNVSSDTPVITLNGVCDITLNGTPKTSANGTTKTLARPAAGAKTGTAATHAASSAGPCKTEVTRAEFDQLMKLVAPTAPPTARRQIATRYVQLLTAANEGIKLGVENEPTFPLMRLQLLAQAAESKLRSDASNVTEADAKTYYDQNQSAFEEVTLTRIFVPRTPPAPATANQASAAAQAAGAPATGSQAQASATDAEGIAKSAHDQLVVGGDPDKIQKSAYEQLKNTTTPPNTKFGAKRRGTLPPTQEQKVFALKPGDVSEVFSDTVGYTVYRVDSKQQLPFDQVKDQAKQRVTQLRLTDAQQQITSASKADYNDAYFGPETAAAAPPRVPPAAAPVQSPNPPQYPVNSQTPTPVTNQSQRSQTTTPKE